MLGWHMFQNGKQHTYKCDARLRNSFVRHHTMHANHNLRIVWDLQITNCLQLGKISYDIVFRPIPKDTCP